MVVFLFTQSPKGRPVSQSSKQAKGKDADLSVELVTSGSFLVGLAIQFKNDLLFQVQKRRALFLLPYPFDYALHPASDLM